MLPTSNDGYDYHLLDYAIVTRMRTVLLLLGLVAVICLSFYLGTQWSERTTDTSGISDADDAQVLNEVDSSTNAAAVAAASSDASAGRASPPATTGTSVTIPGSALTDSQRRLLESFGLDPNALTIDQTVLDCAEVALGGERIAEIQAGAIPTLPEAMQLLGCYGGN